MKFEIDLNKMEMLSFKGKNPNNDDPEKYAKTYECWRANWEHAFQVELGETGFLPSDQFTRQDEIVTLFYDGECAGIGFLN